MTANRTAAGLLALSAMVYIVTALAQGPSAPAGRSHVGHLYLAEKDASYQPVPGGAWGKLKYETSGATFEFVFNGHKLDADLVYALIYYPDPFPGYGAICLGAGRVSPSGEIRIQGSVDTGDLPLASDWNSDPLTTTVPGVTGAKIWLVIAADVDCGGGGMIHWQPADYLFEMQLINYSETP